MCGKCADTAVVTTSVQGDPYWYDGGLMTMRARPAHTGGSISLVDVSVERGKATPLHSHPDAEETLVVLDGELLLHVDGVDHELGAGAAATIRRGTPHAFAVRSPRARLLVAYTPGGPEQFFVEAGEPALRREIPPPAPRDVAAYRAAAERTGLVLLGPPPFDPAVR
jgi:quercetin dioxygenase-like cupin family protein